MSIIKKRGMSVAKLAEVLTNMTREGHGDLTVMLDVEKNGHQLITTIGRGDIGLASDGRKVLVLRKSDDFELPFTINGEKNG